MHIRAKAGGEKGEGVWCHRIQASPGLNSGQVDCSSLAAPDESSSWGVPEAKPTLKSMYNKSDLSALLWVVQLCGSDNAVQTI